MKNTLIAGILVGLMTIAGLYAVAAAAASSIAGSYDTVESRRHAGVIRDEARPAAARAFRNSREL